MELYLIPLPLWAFANETLPPVVADVVKRCNCFLVENERTARRWIGSLNTGIDLRSLLFFTLDKNTEPAALQAFVQTLPEGSCIGVLSEAGCPGIADPGAMAVGLAHQMGWKVIPLPGPSSLLLALMASGMNGQQFCFHGYLPVSRQERAQAIRRLEKDSAKERAAQLFIETPYRNQQLLADLLATCQPATRLCIAANLTAPDQFVRTLTVGAWKQVSPLPDLHKRPTVFILSV